MDYDNDHFRLGKMGERRSRRVSNINCCSLFLFLLLLMLLKIGCII